MVIMVLLVKQRIHADYSTLTGEIKTNHKAAKFKVADSQN